MGDREMENEILDILKDINPYVDIDMNTNLYEEGVLDSMGLLILITELEKKYEVDIPLDNLQLENFECINNILEFINRICEEKK